ncbi:alpha-1,2-mannosyltransferase ALG9 isoform X10 [Mus musculus]|uniref:alpha-1,2-mannosyltransferase ALG9 isoform X10 n=1 Tax=Mus musculus TaxID=10090 RepID=UPI0005ABA587|nr:alpha-1,2-mannosyltransferase ALG9 isoform X10 [Mus musculus]|eukprot:XP_011240682.1 PREDICTED: alpha-1,2-mannosyltransferase ALG9 isoform X5 [Mus musculus]
MALSSSSTWDLTMALGGRAGHSQQATPLHPQVSSSISSHCSSFSSSLSLPSDHHTLTHCGGSCCRLATWPAGPWVTSSFCVAWRVAGRCLCPSAPCARLQKCYHFVFQRYRLEHYTVTSNWLALGTVFLFGLLSFSRSVALFRGYHGPLDLYPEFYRIATDPTIHTVPEGRPVNVCVGKEWYRFPSSFLLPDNWQLQFIPSEFRGQLPKPFAEGPLATRTVPTHMNDQNREEPSRYIDISKCHYLVDLDTMRETPREPNYSSHREEWVSLAHRPFLDASRSSKLLRAFYVPFLSDQYTVYVNYTILKPRKAKPSRKKSGG